MNKINLREMNSWNQYNKLIAEELYNGNQITEEEAHVIKNAVEEIEMIYGKVKSRTWNDMEIVGIN